MASSSWRVCASPCCWPGGSVSPYDPPRHEPIAAFLDLGLRAHVIRAAGLRVLANRGTDASPPPAEAIAAAREHLVLRHGCADWPALVQKLHRTWGLALTVIERFVQAYASAVDGVSTMRPAHCNRIALDGLPPRARDLVDRIQAANRRVSLLDVTTDVYSAKTPVG